MQLAISESQSVLNLLLGGLPGRDILASHVLTRINKGTRAILAATSKYYAGQLEILGFPRVIMSWRVLANSIFDWGSEHLTKIRFMFINGMWSLSENPLGRLLDYFGYAKHSRDSIRYVNSRVRQRAGIIDCYCNDYYAIGLPRYCESDDEFIHVLRKHPNIFVMQHHHYRYFPARMYSEHFWEAVKLILVASGIEEKQMITATPKILARYMCVCGIRCLEYACNYLSDTLARKITKKTYSTLKPCSNAKPLPNVAVYRPSVLIGCVQGCGVARALEIYLDCFGVYDYIPGHVHLRNLEVILGSAKPEETQEQVNAFLGKIANLEEIAEEIVKTYKPALEALAGANISDEKYTELTTRHYLGSGVNVMLRPSCAEEIMRAIGKLPLDAVQDSDYIDVLKIALDLYDSRDICREHLLDIILHASKP